MDAVMAWLEGANHWGWWIFGIVLIVLEVAAPGAVFMWMGIAAGIVGFAAFFVPDLNWEYQFLIFAVLSVVSILVARRYLKARPIETDQPSLNRRGSQYIGRFFTLAEPIVDGRGRLHVDDTMWKIEGPDLPKGQKVTVKTVEGVILRVEAQQTVPDSSS